MTDTQSNDTLQTIIRAPSLTAALRGLGYAFSVRLLYLGETETPSENRFQTAFVRDVLLLLDGVAVIQARSRCRPDSLFWRSFLDCGTRPLGEKLFDGTLPLTRTPLEFSQTDTAPDGKPLSQTAPIRQSRFYHQNDALTLTECFLPELLPFLNGKG